MTSWQVYLILRCDAISIVTSILAVIGSILTIILSICTFAIWSDNRSDTVKEELRKLGKGLKFAIPTSILLILLAVLVPTTKQAAVIILLPKIMSQDNIDFAKDEAAEVYSLLKQWLHNQLDDEVAGIDDAPQTPPAEEP